MIRVWVLTAALNGLVAVAAGAFGAHGLQGRLEPKMLANWETAARYQMYHALALLAVAWFATRASGGPTGVTAVGAWALVSGTAIFCGSLYIMCLTGMRWLGAITPIGGVALLVGWASLAWAAWTQRMPPSPLH